MLVLSVVAAGVTVVAVDGASGIAESAVPATDSVVDRPDERATSRSDAGQPAFDADDPDVERHELTLALDGGTVLSKMAVTSEVTVEGPVTDDTRIELDGHNLNATRGVRTDATYSVHYGDGTPNAPPNAESLDVVGSGPNEVVTDRLFEVELDAATDLRHVRGKYNNGADGPLGEDPGWRSARTEQVGENTYRIQVVATGTSETVDPGLEATDEAGNSVTLSTFDAVEVGLSGEATAQVDATAVGGVAP